MNTTPQHASNPGSDSAATSADALQQLCLEQLKTCYDPELPVNIVDLGLVYVCQVTPLPEGEHEVVLMMTLTSPGCPVADVLTEEIADKLSVLPGVRKVRVEIVFDPPWSMERMTDAARLQLGLA